MGELACKQKIILDGGNAAGLIEALCETTQNLDKSAIERLSDEVAYKIIGRLNKIEDLIIEAQKILIHDVIQYDGPLPKLLS